ncbi:lasso peptide biosynthesis B2 protein [Streptomyces sp. Ag82_O1-15]|uniref:lasso peptide biosynthesis B2 protein n=1 Tax=Streptomyces sp. Ag82_O1-15 TaxID=1938855 RepID=UPI0015C6FA38|nr:lasso peptide biosynthesis B2 protein [Streptomyces sp. Ag82_O1-15]
MAGTSGIPEVFGANHFPGGTSGRYTLAAETALLRLPDRTSRLLNLAGKCYALQETATTILLSVLSDGADAAAHELATRHHMDESAVRRDIAAFVTDLEREGLVQSHTSGYSNTAARPGAGTAPSRAGLLLAALARGSDRRMRIRAFAVLAVVAVFMAVRGWPNTVSSCLACDIRPVGANRGADRPSPGDISQAVRSAVARFPLPIDCKARALTSWLLLRSASLPATMVVGAKAFPLRCHCWCESDGRIVADDPERCAEYTEIFSYSPQNGAWSIR